MTDLEAWREGREPGWYHDIGYALQDVVRGHRYDYSTKGTRPDDPGWHECSCGEWEGYWSGFEPHVADHLRALVMERAVVCDHKARCCRTHKTHSSPHIGCILR